MAGDSPLVSIIVPHYNGKEFICDALKSIYAQTYSNIEVIVVDDASPRQDDIVFLQSLSDKFDFNLLLHTTNKGVAMTMADAVKASTGEYIAELSQDDLYKPEKIEKQLSYILDNDLDAVYAVGDILKEGCADTITRDASKTKSLVDSGKALSRLYNQNLPGVSLQGLLAKREVFIEDILPIWKDYLSDDWPVNVRLFEKYKVGFIDEPLWTGRSHANNTSKNIWKWLAPQIEVPARMAPQDVKFEAIGNRFISMARRLMKADADKAQIASLAFAGLMLVDSSPQNKRAVKILHKIPIRIRQSIIGNKLSLIANGKTSIDHEFPNDIDSVTWETLGKEISKAVESFSDFDRLDKIGEILFSLGHNILSNPTMNNLSIKVLLAAYILIEVDEYGLAICNDLYSCDNKKLIRNKSEILRVLTLRKMRFLWIR